MQLEDISKAQLHLFAAALRQVPSDTFAEYATRLYCIEAQLDRSLLRPDFLHRLMQKPQSFYAPLCELHRILNAKIVHQIFLLVATEVGVRLNKLVVAGRDKLGHETWDCSILNLRSLHGAWLQPEVFWDTFGQTLDVPKSGFSSDDYMTKWQVDQPICEACILARIGGDLATVFDLQMIVKSRTHTGSVRKYHEPRLSKVITGWLTAWEPYYPSEEWRQKLEWNRLRASRLKAVRKAIAKEKRSERGRHKDETERSEKRKPAKVTTPTVTHTAQRPPGSQKLNAETNPTRSTSGDRVQEDSSLAPAPARNEAEVGPISSDEDENFEIRDTIHDAENEIINSYTALISTPFLPGMDSHEHEKRSSRLSQYSELMNNQDEASVGSTVPAGEAHYPPGRSQSTRDRRFSNYSESVYSQAAGSAVTKTAPSSKGVKAGPTSLQRSKTVQERRTSKSSWVTPSIAPSETSTQAARTQHSRKSRKHERKFEPIAEETSLHRRSHSGHDTRPVSPLRRDEQKRRDVHRSASNRSVSSSPISPMSMRCSSRANQTPKAGSTHEQGGRSQTAKISSRLSRPFDTPAADPDSLANSVEQPRNRDSNATDKTTWSAMFGPERDRIRRLEEQYQKLNVESEPPKSKHRDRKK